MAMPECCHTAKSRFQARAKNLIRLGLVGENASQLEPHLA
jgi:hypothetical protein